MKPDLASCPRISFVRTQRSAVCAGLIGLAAVFACAGASAEQAGLYQGTTADGHPINIVLAPTEGGFGLFSVILTFRAKCKGHDAPLEYGAGYFFRENLIKDHKKKFGFTYSSSISVVGEMTFPDDNIVTGTVAARTAAFFPRNATPSDTQFCLSRRQTFSAAFTEGARHSAKPSSNVQSLPAVGRVTRWGAKALDPLGGARQLPSGWSSK